MNFDAIFWVEPQLVFGENEVLLMLHDPTNPHSLYLDGGV